LAIAAIVQSNVPEDLSMVGVEIGLPVLPISDIVLHMVNAPASESLTCFADHLIRSFREKD
jgi:hypothetical protein